MRYESESKTWSLAAGAVRERVRLLPEFERTRAEVVAAAVARCRGKSVAEMRELGGFSAVLESLVRALPSGCRVNVGSKLLPATVAGELVFEIASMRSDVQQALAAERKRGR
jgi:hypothetical protein